MIELKDGKAIFECCGLAQSNHSNNNNNIEKRLNNQNQTKNENKSIEAVLDQFFDFQ